MRFQIRNSNSKAQPYYVRIVGSNGTGLFTSETYHQKGDAVHAAKLVQVGASTAQIVDETSSTARAGW